MTGPELFTVNAEGKCELSMHRDQLRAWDSTARIVAVIAGSQGGKTSWGPWWLWREIQRCGAGDYIAATATFDLFKLKMLPAIREVFEHTLQIARYWSGDKVLELCDPETGKFLANRADDPMWGRIILRSASSEGGLESATGKAAWLDEAGMDAFPLEAFDGVRRRLTLYRGRILITTTPYNLGWLKQQIIDKDGQNGIEVISFESIANPKFSRAEFEELRLTMPTWKFNMFHRGILSRPPGMIYHDFIDKYREQGGHKVKPFTLPQHWPRYVGVDPGGVNTAKIWLAHDTDTDVFYLYRESLDGDKSIRQHATETRELALANNERVVMHFVGNKGEGQVRRDWEAAGVYNVSEPPFHEVENGIDRVIQLLKSFRLFVFDICTGTLDQIGRYARKLDAAGNTTEEIKNKQEFHYLDGLRYDVVGALEHTASNWEPVLA